MARRNRPTVDVLPRARRLTESLRDLGYETVEAVADLIDNSIAARAKNVDVTLHFDGGNSWIRISDDGHGMNAAAINEALVYGAERDYDTEDLGKFGLGLKTASMSQCRSLSVASRTSKSAARIEARQWDLDYVEETNRWRALVLRPDERPRALVEPLRHHRGTVVLWENLDRILTYKNPGSEWARNRLLDLAEHLDEHLGMVFHRFLSGDVPRRAKLTITINGTLVVEPWDPFARDEKLTETLKPREFEIHGGSGSGIVRLEPFILPPKDGFSSEAAHRRASGPNNWNRQQGFYIYRAHRLIQSGGWSRMRTQDEHTKLARVGLFFSPELDAAFRINVAKMRVLFPTDLKEQIKPTVDQVVKRAQAVYRQKAHTGGGGGGSNQSGGGNGSGPSNRGTGGGAAGGDVGGSAGGGPSGGADGPGGVGTTTFAKTRRGALESAARATDHEDALKAIIGALDDIDPEVKRDLGW